MILFIRFFVSYYELWEIDKDGQEIFCDKGSREEIEELAEALRNWYNCPLLIKS